MKRVGLSWNQFHRLGLTLNEQRAAYPHNSHYSTYAVRVLGELDMNRLASAWRAVQLRHAVLLSSFDLASRSWCVDSGEPGALWATDFDATGSDKEVLAAAEKELARAMCAPFDLNRGPLARMHAIRVSDKVTLVGMAVEHLVSDGWSLVLLSRDLWQFYVNGDRTDISLIDRSFPEFVNEQNIFLESMEGRRALGKWAEHLQIIGALPQIRFPGFIESGQPIDYSATSSIGYSVARQTYVRLRSLGSKFGLSPIGMVNAALSATIHELTRLTDFGTLLSVANRADRATRGTVGWVSGKVVVPIHVKDDSNRSSFLEEFANQLALAFDNAHLPLAAVMNELDPHLVGIPCPHPWVAFNPMPAAVGRRVVVAEVSGLELIEFDVPSGWYDASVAISATDSGEDLRGKFSFKSNWYDSNSIQAVADRLVDVLERWAVQGGSW